MYVCSCNGLTDTQIRSAITAGAGRTHDVYAACNCRAQCGCCTATILGMLRDGSGQPLPALDAGATLAH